MTKEERDIRMNEINRLSVSLLEKIEDKDCRKIVALCFIERVKELAYDPTFTT